VAELWLPPEDRLALWEPEGEQVRVIGWRPGPAGVSTIELAPGLHVATDHASPTTLTEITVDLVDGRIDDGHLPLLATLLGEEETETLRSLPGSNADRRPRSLAGRAAGRSASRSPTELEWLERSGGAAARTFARLTLAADLGDDADRSDVAQAVAWFEAARAAVDLRLDDLVSEAARQGAILLGQATATIDPEQGRRVVALIERTIGVLDPLLQAQVRRALDAFRGRSAGGREVARRARRSGPPAPAAQAPDALLVAAMAAPVADRGAEELGVPDTEPLEVEGEERGWAGVTRGYNVLVTAVSRAEGSWARVFRRSDGLLLGLAPLRREATHGAGSSATVVVPPTAPDDLVVDLVGDPTSPRRRPIHGEVRRAVRRGRMASRLTRLGDPGATSAWADTAEQWRQMGDVQRANLAERHGRRDDGRRRAGSARFLQPEPLLSDELP
jgi:hypothetical protein